MHAMTYGLVRTASVALLAGALGTLPALAQDRAKAPPSKGLHSEGVQERAAIALHRSEVVAGRRMAAGTGILATIGSIGPFVGLLGTVGGIMGSLIGIANSNTTNLAVSAPGIAEALLVAGIGLVAAIPGLVIYNSLTRAIGGYRILMGNAVAVILCHLSRDRDRREQDGYPSQRVTVPLAAG